MGILLTCMSVHRVCMQCPWKPEKDVGSPGTGVTDNWEPRFSGRTVECSFIKEFIYFMCPGLLPACMSKIGVTDSCELPYRIGN